MKWKGYGEDRSSTWEPWENLLSADVEAEARATRTASLGRSEAALMKAVVVTLKAALEERSLDTSGLKPVLVSLLLEALEKEDAKKKRGVAMAVGPPPAGAAAVSDVLHAENTARNDDNRTAGCPGVRPADLSQTSSRMRSPSPATPAQTRADATSAGTPPQLDHTVGHPLSARGRQQLAEDTGVSCTDLRRAPAETHGASLNTSAQC